MKTSDDLFLLIKSMNKSEKGYFKKKSFEGKYLNLFDQIEKQTISENSYNENEVKKKFNSGNLTFTKNYLYNSILETLYSYHRSESELIRLSRSIGTAEILFKKGLIDQSLKVISRTKTLIYGNGLYYLLPSIISVEKLVLMNLGSESDFEVRYRKIYEEEKHVYSILRNLNDYKFYSDSIGVLVAKGDIFRNKSDMVKAKKIISHSLFKNEKHALCKEAKTLFHHTLASYYFAIFNFDKALVYVKKLLDIIEPDKNIKFQNPYNYLITLQNYVYLCLHKDKFPDAKEALEKSEKILVSNKTIPDGYRNILNIRNFILRLQILQAQCKFAESINYLEKKIDGFIKIESVLNNELNNIIRIYISTSYFLSNNLDAALHWLNKILNDKSVETRSDIYCAAKIFNLIIHYELGNIQHIEYVSKSTRRYLLKEKKLFKFENVLLNFFKKIPDVKNPSELTFLLKVASAELKKIFNDPYERQVLNYFDFSGWIESKIEKLPLGEYLMRNYSGIAGAENGS